jgi:hypothetical protein
MTDDQQQQQLSALLRLKRYEQPPAGYFDKLLHDVHRRQRADLLRRPVWKLALERVQTLFGLHSMSYGQYAGAMAALVVLGVAVVTLSMPRNGGTTAAVVSTSPTTGLVEQSPVNLRSSRPSNPVLSLQNSRIMVAASDPFETAAAGQGAVSAGQPRYVLDAQPVSYEATKVSFNF